MPRWNHVGLTVSDLERSIAFYREVVGLWLIPETSNLEISGDWFDRLTDNPGSRFRVAHLELEGLQLQLVEYTAAGGDRLPLAHRNIGNPHLCIAMEDIDRRHAELSATGQCKLSPLEELPGERRSFYVTDPDGVLVEFIDLPY